MGQRNRHHQSKRQRPRAAAPAPVVRAQPIVVEKKPPVSYGKPFTLLEDNQKQTFIYNLGQWVRHSRSIAECRQDSQVNELPQKINGMTRYEVRSPIASAT